MASGVDTDSHRSGGDERQHVYFLRLEMQSRKICVPDVCTTANVLGSPSRVVGSAARTDRIDSGSELGHKFELFEARRDIVWEASHRARPVLSCAFRESSETPFD
jgi:hypothetical protein